MTMNDLVVSTSDRPWRRPAARRPDGTGVALDFDGTTDQVMRSTRP